MWCMEQNCGFNFFNEGEGWCTHLRCMENRVCPEKNEEPLTDAEWRMDVAIEEACLNDGHREFLKCSGS